MNKKDYIIVKDRYPRVSEVLWDCATQICVPASKDEPLSSILNKICNKISQIESGASSSNTISIIEGDNITITEDETQSLTDNPVYTISATGGSGEGTVTSIGLGMPSIFTVVGSPVTTSGNILASLNAQSANLVFAGPSSGAAAVPTFRSLVAADTPFSWSILGNTGTAYATNFLGTTDLQHLSFRTNNINSGRIEVGSTPESNNSGTYLGHGAARVANPLLTARNVAMGYESMYNFVQGGSNVAFGYRTLYSGTTFSENSAFGNWALYSNTTGNRNVGVGQSTLYQNTTGSHNTALGTFALELTNGGGYNTAVGRDSMRSNKMGNFNSALGFLSLVYNTTSVESIDITSGGSGYTTASVVISAPQVGSPGGISVQATATATINAGVITGITITNRGAGYSTSYGAVTATIIGDGVGAVSSVNLTSGDYNVGVGYGASAFNYIGKNNISIGRDAGNGLLNAAPSVIDDSMIFLGYGASRSVGLSSETKLEKAIAIGYNAKVGASSTMALGGTGSDAVNVGINTETARKKLDVVGGDALVHELTVGRGNNSVTTNSAFGFEALNSANTNIGCVAIGYQALRLSSGSGAHTAVGYRALASHVNEFSCTAVGYAALESATSYRNTAVGAAAARNLTGGVANVAIGTDTMSISATSISFNSAVGDQSCKNITSNNNTAIGYGAGCGITSGGGSIAVGIGAMGRSALFLGGTAGITGSDNIAIGANSLFNVTSGQRNVALGFDAGISLTTGSYNVIIGGNTGGTIATLSNRVLISDGAGNERVYIDNNGKTRLTAYGAGIHTGTTAYYLGTSATGDVIEIDPLAISIPISSLDAAIQNNTIDNGNFKQSWQWNSLDNTALQLWSNTTVATATNQKLFELIQTGAHAASGVTSYGQTINNWHSGTSSINYGAIFDAAFGTTNIALELRASSGTNNYALIVPASFGRVGIGTSAPSDLAHINGNLQIGTAGSTAGQIKLSGATSGTITINTVGAAGTWTLTLPTDDGDNGEFLQTDGNGTTTWAPSPASSGKYTPTLTSITNIDSSTAYECHYTRINNIVTVSGLVDINCTAVAGSQLDLSLPVASNLSDPIQLNGLGFESTTGITSPGHGFFGGDDTNDRASFLFTPRTTDLQTYRFTFTYEVI